MSSAIDPVTAPGTDASAAAATAESLRPRLTGGQRASAILGGIVGHTIFAIGWFGFGFVLVGALFSAVIGGLLRSLLGRADSEAITNVLDRAGVIVWILLLVFTVGAVAFMALGIMVSGAILRRGDVHRPWRTTWTAVLVAAAVDIPAFWIAISISTLVADSGAAVVVLPPLFALLVVIVIGALCWWWMAHVNRPKAPVGATGSAVDARDDAREALEPLQQPAGSLGEQIAGDEPGR